MRGSTVGLAFAVAVFGALGLAACEPEHAHGPAEKARVTGVQLSTFEVRDDQVDRFEHCPPPGEVGQAWVPPIPEWHPPAASASAAVPESAVEASGGAVPTGQSPDAPEQLTPEPAAALNDEAANQTRAAFRTCYHHGLLFDPTQDGHVAVVLRVDRAGKVAAVETWGACDLSNEALVCLRDEAKHVKLHPPQGGAATLTIPAVFTSGKSQQTQPNDAFAAAAYVAIESMRPRLHACETAAKYAHTGVFASAVMTIDIDAKGQGVHVAVDQWKGGHELLACAAEVVRDARFPPPSAGQGKVILPIVFNPRPGQG